MVSEEIDEGLWWRGLHIDDVLAPELGERELAYELAVIRWGRGGEVPLCPHCHEPLWQSHQRPRMFGCSHHPRFRRSVTAGTLFAYAKLRLKKIFWMIEILRRESPPNNVQMAAEVGVDKDTSYLWRQRIMAAIAQGGDPIVGIIEVARKGVSVCGPQPAPPPPCPEASDEVLRTYNVHRRPWPLTMLADFDGGALQFTPLKGAHRQLCGIVGYEPMLWVNPKPYPLLDVQSEVAYTHLGVSVRWLPRYAKYIVRRSSYGSLWQVVRRMLALPALTLCRLRPGGSPPEVLDASFVPQLRCTPAALDSQRHPGTFYAGRPLPKSGPSRS